MNDKSPSSCVSRNDVANLGCDVASVISTILCFAYLPRYLQPVSKTKATDNPKEAGVNAVGGLSLKFRQSSKMREMINTGTLLNDLVTASTTDDNEVKDEEKDEGTDSGTSGGSGNDDGNNPL